MTTPEFVNADMYIGDVVMRYPVTAQVMMSYGLHCVGCHVSNFETIRQGAMGHGQMDDEDVEILISEMNEAIAEHEVSLSSETLTVTSRAVEKISEFASREENKEGLFLRVKVIPGGCSGFKYDLDFDTQALDDDVVLVTEGLDIRVDPDSADFLKGSVLDYLDGLDGSGFKIENPSASENCGCGKSFS
ncbi:MAG: iron-sulfur cluster assembly accessory protein [Candidatus Woesearchaeota archaeon]